MAFVDRAVIAPTSGADCYGLAQRARRERAGVAGGQDHCSIHPEMIGSINQDTATSPPTSSYWWPVLAERGPDRGARRPPGKARRPRIPGVSEGGATPPGGMPRPRGGP